MELILGHAKFTGPKEVLVNDVTLTAKHILVATGTKPIIPDVPGKYFLNCYSFFIVFTKGAEYGITSDGFFELEELPKYSFDSFYITKLFNNRKVVVSGSGYIAVELAGILNALGSEVSLVIRRGKVLNTCLFTA